MGLGFVSPTLQSIYTIFVIVKYNYSFYLFIFANIFRCNKDIFLETFAFTK